jgi:hypothetical protein
MKSDLKLEFFTYVLARGLYIGQGLVAVDMRLALP